MSKNLKIGLSVIVSVFVLFIVIAVLRIVLAIGLKLLIAALFIFGILGIAFYFSNLNTEKKQ